MSLTPFFPFTNRYSVFIESNSTLLLEEMYQFLEGPFYQFFYTSLSFDGDVDRKDGYIPGQVLGNLFMIGGIRIGQVFLELCFSLL